jgi:deoxyribonuclease V
VPTIGVTKSRLFGRAEWDERSEGLVGRVIDPHDGTPLGSVLRRPGASRKPLYVSPGQQISIESATAITRRTFASHRLPTPIYWADRLSRRLARS